MSQFFSLFDKKAVSFSTPFFMPSIPEACRAVAQAGKDGKAMFAQYPADFALYLISHWDHKTGCMTPTSHGGPLLVEEVANLVQILSTYQNTFQGEKANAAATP